MIKCITFDLDDTLWKIEPVIKSAEINFHRWLKDNYPAAADQFSIESLRKLMKQTALESPKIKHNLTQVRLKAYTHIKNIHNFPDDMPVKAYDYFMGHRNNVVLFEGVEEVLSQLKNKYRLGTITNGNASLEKIGIQKYFDFEIKASDTGFMKPDVEIFNAAVKKANCDPVNMVHIGDNYEKDIVGAMTANINYIWLNHNNEHKKDVDKKNIIKSFLQVPQALKNIG